MTAQCGRIHLGPIKRTSVAIVCQCCGKSLTVKERIIFFRIRIKAHEIMLLALLSNSPKGP